MPTVSFAQSAEDTELADIGEKEKIGLNFSLELSSIYNFRGLNFYQGGSQHDQHFVLIPNIVYQLLDTGVWFSYRSAYQVTGENRSEIVDGGYGDEQNLGAGYRRNFANDRLTLNTSFIYYFYPFSNKTAAGTECPSYIEPFAGVTYHSFADISVNFLYYLGVQSAVRDFSYFYANPRVGRTFEISPLFELFTGAGFGYKIFKDYGNIKDNVYDVVVDIEVPFKPLKNFFIAPSLHYGWTNLRQMNFFDESMLYGGVKLGASL